MVPVQVLILLILIYGILKALRRPAVDTHMPVAVGSLWTHMSGPSGVSLDPPVCPPVPLVSLGSYSSIVI